MRTSRGRPASGADCPWWAYSPHRPPRAVRSSCEPCPPAGSSRLLSGPWGMTSPRPRPVGWCPALPATPAPRPERRTGFPRFPRRARCPLRTLSRSGRRPARSGWGTSASRRAIPGRRAPWASPAGRASPLRRGEARPGERLTSRRAPAGQMRPRRGCRPRRGVLPGRAPPLGWRVFRRRAPPLGSRVLRSRARSRRRPLLSRRPGRLNRPRRPGRPGRPRRPGRIPLFRRVSLFRRPPRADDRPRRRPVPPSEHEAPNRRPMTRAGTRPRVARHRPVPRHRYRQPRRQRRSGWTARRRLGARRRLAV